MYINNNTKSMHDPLTGISNNSNLVMDDEQHAVEVHVRKILCELSIINRADGSAKFDQGETSVTCGVYGPAEVKAFREQSDRATMEVTVRQQVGIPGSVEHQLEALVATCCDSVVITSQHPHTAVSVTVQTNASNGSVFSCVFHSLCLALMDTSLPMMTTFSALTCGFKEDSGEMITDPDKEEEQQCDCLITYVVDRQGKLLCSHTQGLFTRQQFNRGFGAARALVDKMSDFYRTAICRKMLRMKEGTVKVNQ